MSERLYYKDSHINEFKAVVTLFGEDNGRMYAELDRTAFFPEGGGQLADTGVIGEVRVLDVQEKEGRILHYIADALEVGQEYDCAIDWEQRFRRMQNHSGEHIVSGITHTRFGYDNVGFHMGDDYVTLDFNGELTAGDVAELELAANRAVWENVAISTEFPNEEALKTLEYRSKLELSGEVRIVTIEGYDKCACCAPHVKRTGEIGVIKLVDFMKHRGGMRLTMRCGIDAYKDYAEKQQSAAEISALLSAKRSDIYPAVKKIFDELQEERYKSAELKKSMLAAEAAKLEYTEGNLCFFYPEEFDSASLRSLVNEAVKRCGGIAAAFSGTDEDGYNYVIGSTSADLRAKAKEINSAIDGRGGGRPEMIQGSAKATRAVIEKFFN